MLNNIFSRQDESGPDETLESDEGVALFETEEDDFGTMDDFQDENMFDDLADDEGDVTADLENRVDELEKEIAGISSTMNTIKRENEDISGSLDGIEENIRSLLDIYEMVTRGVNPFVDDPEPGNIDQSAFGVFNPDTTGESELDESGVTDEEFFADDVDEPADSTTGLDSENVNTEETSVSFEDLKEEYESSTESTENVEGDLQFVEDTVAGTTEPTAKPYLQSIPHGYVADLLIMDWLQYLVDQSDPTDTRRALAYYEAIEWITEPVADHLETYLSGFGLVDNGKEEGVDTVPTTLSMTQHTQSLRYICQLTNNTPASVVLNGSGVSRQPTFETE